MCNKYSGSLNILGFDLPAGGVRIWETMYIISYDLAYRFFKWSKNIEKYGRGNVCGES